MTFHTWVWVLEWVHSESARVPASPVRVPLWDPEFPPWWPATWQTAGRGTEIGQTKEWHEYLTSVWRPSKMYFMPWKNGVNIQFEVGDKKFSAQVKERCLNFQEMIRNATKLVHHYNTFMQELANFCEKCIMTHSGLESRISRRGSPDLTINNLNIDYTLSEAKL